MAGTLRTRLEQFVSGDNQAVSAQLYTNLVAFLDGHPGLTRIARSHGAGGTSETVGSDAFSVVRFEPNAGRTFPFYLFVGVGNVGRTSPRPAWIANGGSTSGSSGYLALSAAVGVGGDANPWNGSTHNDGSDTYSARLWDVPSGGTSVKVLPASNASAGTGGAMGGDVMCPFAESTDGQSHRVHVMADDDQLVVAVDARDDNSWTVLYLGMPDVVPAFLSHPNPLCGFMTSNGFGTSDMAVFSDTAGGFTHVDDAEPLRQSVPIRAEVPPRMTETNMHPHEMTMTFEAPPLDVVSTQVGARGVLGTVTFVRVARNVPTEGASPALDWVALGSTALSILVPWDGVTLPGSGTTAEGVSG